MTKIMALNNICNMKKYFSIIASAIIVFAFASCAESVDNQVKVVDGVRMKTVTVKTSIAETKTTLDANHENIVWSTGDKISIFNDYDNTNLEADYIAEGDITVEVPATTTEIYAHYPYYSGNNSGPEEVSVYISNNQTQTNPGHLNGYYYPMVAKGTVSPDNKALISFYPVAGALALNLYHTGLSGEESVQSVKVTPASTTTSFIGRQTTDITGNSIVYTTAASSDPITVTLTNALALGNTKPTNKKTFEGQIYVCLAKKSYANVNFEIETDKGRYSITSNSNPFDLVNNDFVPVNINLNSASFTPFDSAVDPTTLSWTLVKDNLAIGDKIVIAAAGSEVAMSTTQNNNNRSEIAITKSGNALTAVENVQVFEVVAGSETNSFAFKCLNGDQIRKYIAAASSSSNNMHSNSEVDANASWIVGINSSDGVASVVAQGTYSRNIIKYNPSSSLFSCYGSTTTNVADIVFYRAGLPAGNISFPEDSYTANLGESFTAPSLTNPHNLSVTYSSSNTDVATVDNTGAVTILAVGTTTITASFAGNSSFSANDASYELEVFDPSVPRPETIVFANLGLENGVQYSDPFNGGNFTVKFGGGGNDGKYYDAGTGIRTYGNGTVTVSSANYTIVRIDYSFSGSSNAPTADNYTINSGSFTPGASSVWTGESKNVVLTNTASSGHWRLQSVMVTYGAGSSTPKTLSSITVTPPTKTVYTVGESFNASGMSVTATYSDATTADVTSSVTTDFATQVASAGNKTVTVSYTEGGVTATGTFVITVNSAGGSSTSSLIFTAACGGSGTSNDGVSWTVTSDGTESNFDNTRGIHYGTNNAQVEYIRLSTSGISGTITKVVVNASTASGVTASTSVTVGGAAFGGDAQSLSTTATNYVFEGNATGQIIVTVSKPSKATKALYVKSVVVTYSN